jgi:hypothetical protein
MARIRDIGSGLWVWSREHPDWTPDSDFEGPVTSTCVTSGGEVVLLELGWGVAGPRPGTRRTPKPPVHTD